MTRKKFEELAVREAEKQLGVPKGWWGSHRDVQGPFGQRVYYNHGVWNVSLDGVFAAKYTERADAIKKAKGMKGI